MTPDQLKEIIDAINLRGAGLSVADVLGLLGTVIAIIGLIFAGYQLRGLNSQIRDAKKAYEEDHERSRRQATIDVLQFFQDGSKPEHNKLVTLLDRIDEDLLIALQRSDKFALSGEYKKIACSVLVDTFDDIYERYDTNDAEVSFSHAETMRLRYLMIEILNHYEICYLPWKMGIVDKESFEEQFKFLVDMRNGKYCLEAARRVVGDDKFPATNAFKNKMFPPSSENNKGNLPLDALGKVANK